MIDVSLAYAHKDRQDYLTMSVEQGTSIYQALLQANWLTQYPELGSWCEQIRLSENSLSTRPNAKKWLIGIYSQKKSLDYILQADDRIEVYRQLECDPMRRRKQRAR